MLSERKANICRLMEVRLYLILFFLESPCFITLGRKKQAI